MNMVIVQKDHASAPVTCVAAEMNWNLRYSNDKELSIDADFTPDESFESTAEMAKKMRQYEEDRKEE